MNDLDERAWWVFQLPEAVRYVPAVTEIAARAVMRASSHTGAPVDAWPCIGTRWCSRQALAAELLRKANA